MCLRDATLSTRASTCLIGLVLLLAGPATAQQPGTPPDKIDQYIKSQMNARHIPGLALLVVRDGRIGTTSRLTGRSRARRSWRSTARMG